MKKRAIPALAAVLGITLLTAPAAQAGFWQDLFRPFTRGPADAPNQPQFQPQPPTPGLQPHIPSVTQTPGMGTAGMGTLGTGVGLGVAGIVGLGLALSGNNAGPSTNNTH